MGKSSCRTVRRTNQPFIAYNELLVSSAWLLVYNFPPLLKSGALSSLGLIKYKFPALF